MSLCSNESGLSHFDRPGCFLRTDTLGRFDTVAGIRIISSLLGLFGAASVIFSVLIKRRFLNAEIHPIFMLSLSDCVLAVLWISGSSIWLASPDTVDDAWCYAVTVLTIIMECVAINLTLVYAIFAYLKIRKTDLAAIMAHLNQSDLTWKKVLMIYSCAWIIPIVLVMFTLTVTQVSGPFIQSANDCSCWCMPSLINVEPFVLPKDKGSQTFIELQGRLDVSLGVILILHYIIVFGALVVLYFKVLLKIRMIRKEHDDIVFGRKNIDSLTQQNHNYGTTEATRLVFGQSQAKKRVVLFLTVFICSGLFNMMLAIVLVAFVSPHLRVANKFRESSHNHPSHFYAYLSFLYAQSITLPMQGFMNAIVYGWTRDDFVQTIAIQSPESAEVHENLSVDGGTEMEESERNYEEFVETIQHHSDDDDDDDDSD